MKKTLFTIGLFALVVLSIMVLDPTLTPSWLKGFMGDVGAVPQQPVDSAPAPAITNSTNTDPEESSANDSKPEASERSLGILTPGVPPRLGEIAPDFALRDLDGSVVKLSDYIGKKLVVLNFWATWCSPCVVEMPDLEEIYQEHMDELVILGIDNQESIDVVNQFLDEEVAVTYPILMDTDGQVTLGYNIFAQPTTFFVDRQGVITPINSFPGKFGAFTPGELIERIDEFLEHDRNQNLTSQGE